MAGEISPGMLETLYAKAKELLVGAPPTEKAPPKTWDDQYTENLMRPFGIDPQRDAIPSVIQGYRADPTNKYGGGDGLETQPFRFDRNYTTELYTNARAIRKFRNEGIPQIEPEEMAALVLKEGMPDGHSRLQDYNNKELSALYQKLVDGGYAPGTARFVTMLKEKDAVARRLGIPFAEAWNGTGRSDVTGKTGADYAKSYKHFQKAARHPKNAGLVNFIRRAMEAEK